MNRLSPDQSNPGLNSLSKLLADTAQKISATVRDVPAKALLWHERRKGLSALKALSDYQLRDIGICRGDIVMVAYGLKDPREVPPMVAVAPAATRAVPAAKQPEGCNDDSGFGHAA
jgi:uncharacterized protein YjiS (DUF1127 family)